MNRYKFKQGQRVKVVSEGDIYSSYDTMFLKLKFKNTVKNNSDGCLEGRIFGRAKHEYSNINLYAVHLTNGKEILIGEDAIVLVPPDETVKISREYIANISSTDIEVGCQTISKKTFEKIVKAAKKTGLIK